MSYDRWEVKTLKEITEITMGQSPKSEYYNQNMVGKPFLQGNRTFGEKYPTYDTWCTEPKKIAKQNDVLISVRAPVGDLNVANKELCIGRGLCSLRMKNGSNEFLYYLLASNIKDIINVESGSVFGSINKKTIELLKFKIPEFQEQEAIANILSSLDDKIELNNKINKNLEELAQTIYKRWFVDFEFPNEDGEPYKSSGGEMVESEFGVIPIGWKISLLDEITDFNKRGISPVYTNDKHGIPVINQRCVRNHTIIEEAVQFHDIYKKEFSKEMYHKAWDVLINSMGVGTLGRVSVSSVPHNRLIHSCITILRAKRDIVLEPFFSYLILSLEEKLIKMGEGTTGQTSLNNKLLGKINVIVPKIDQQANFSRIVNYLQQKIDINYRENIRLSNIRDNLLPKLMSGEIEVPIEE